MHEGKEGPSFPKAPLIHSGNDNIPMTQSGQPAERGSSTYLLHVCSSQLITRMGLFAVPYVFLAAVGTVRELGGRGYSAVSGAAERHQRVSARELLEQGQPDVSTGLVIPCRPLTHATAVGKSKS